MEWCSKREDRREWGNIEREKEKERTRKRDSCGVGSWREGERERNADRERTVAERAGRGGGSGARVAGAGRGFGIRGCFQRSTQCSLVSRAGRTGENVRVGPRKEGSSRQFPPPS